MSAADRMDTLRTDLPSRESPPHVLRGRHVLVKDHAQGGLGKVSLALDPRLQRTVALKEIRPDRQASPEAVQRFVNEATITGQLEHPGVVPVYALEEDETGRPYYTMRFIRGRTLTTAIADYHSAPTALAFRTLLQRFIGVCQAVAYAHHQQVLHRDLKPDNILLGDYGETLVVDWGLAKKLGTPELPLPAAPPPHPVSGTETPEMSLDTPVASVAAVTPLTRVGQVLGTPAFMSPEQAAGEIDRLSPATDIYALGAILYALLTGKPPYEGTVFDILQQLQQGKPPTPPTAVSPDVPRALAAVCLKAMAPQARDRYAMAALLAQEVEHWLADEPVAAYAEPWGERLRRWLRRHRTAMYASLALLVATVPLLALLAYQSDQARQQSEQEQQLTEQQRQRTEEQRQQADQQRGRAQANLSKALRAVDEMLTKVSEDRFQHLPGFAKERRQILDKALRVYQELLEENSTDPRVCLETGKALTRMGDIHTLLGQRTEAIAVLDRAIALLAKLVADDPETVDYRAALAHAQGEYGTLFWEQDHTRAEKEKARDAFRRAKDLWLEVVRRAPNDWNHLARLAMLHYRLALVQHVLGQRAEAEKDFQETIRLHDRLRTALPDSHEHEGTLAKVYASMGYFYYRQAKFPAAADCFRKSLTILEKLAPLYPTKVKYQSERVYSTTTLADILAMTHRRAEALTLFQQGRAFMEPLVQAHPDIPQYSDELANLYGYLGGAMLKGQQPLEALQLMRQAMALRVRILRTWPEFKDNHFVLAGLGSSVTQLAARHAPEAERESYQREALNAFAELAAKFPDRLEFGVTLGGNACNLGQWLAHRRQQEQALVMFAQAQAALEKVLARNPEQRNAVTYLRNTFWGRADALSQMGRHADALADWDRAVTLSPASQAVALRWDRLRSLAVAGDMNRAWEEASALAREPSLSGTHWLALARAAALLTQRSQKDASFHERCAAQAVTWLAQALKKAVISQEQVRKESDFAPLLERADLQRALDSGTKK